MKRIHSIILAVLFISQICNAQINNPKVFVTENGSNSGNGVGYGAAWFYQPISADCFVQNVYNGVYSGNIEVRFAGGDYYTDFVFSNIPTNIQSIKMYGGWDPNAPMNKRGFDDRDFYHYETRFHATGHSDLIGFSGVGYYYPNGTDPCIVDGITLTGDGSSFDYSALVLLYGDHVISQCKFEKFNTSTWLLWLETAGHTVTFTNCLFYGNAAKHLMALCTHANLINVTIADNTLSNDMFVPFSQYNQYTQVYSPYYNYNLYNSILYNNSNIKMEHNIYASYFGIFNVSHSILQSNEGWINNIANNMIGSTYDPIFNSSFAAPYSCNYFSSPAIATGSSALITLCPFYDSNIMDYDVANMYRYFDFYATTTDRGAYQNGYEDGTYLYNAVAPIVSAPQRHGNGNTNTNLQMLSLTDLPEGTKFTLYDISGKIVYTTSAAESLNALSKTINRGMYVAVVSSEEGHEIASKKIVIP